MGLQQTGATQATTVRDFSALSRPSNGQSSQAKPNPVDAHVGNRLRVRRTLLGLSQEKVGEAMGLTFQQVQKYERGANRIGASRLWDMSRILNCPVSYFFEEMDDETQSASPRNANGQVNPPREDDPLLQRETLELVRAYYSITDYDVRRRIYDLARSLAIMTGGAEPEQASEKVA
jgi:transcriptional regulator with XRE-family HTH domain